MPVSSDALNDVAAEEEGPQELLENPTDLGSQTVMKDDLYQPQCPHEPGLS